MGGEGFLIGNDSSYWGCPDGGCPDEPRARGRFHKDDNEISFSFPSLALQSPQVFGYTDSYYCTIPLQFISKNIGFLQGRSRESAEG